MKISIIIPVYNVAPYVEECIRSVMNQTMTEGVECIIVDDCGQDNSMAIVERVLAREGYSECEDGSFISNQSSLTFRILHHEHNRGLSAARNTGIDAARGEYIYFLDSDDWIYSDCLYNLYGMVLLYPDVDIVQGMVRHEDKENNPWIDHPTTLFNVPTYANDKQECRHRFQAGHYLSMAQNRLIKRMFFIKNLLYFKEGLLHEDEHWMIFAGKKIGSIAYCRKPTYFYRLNPNGIIATAGDKLFYSMCQIIDDIFERVSVKDRFRDEIEYVLSHIYLYEAKGYNPINKIKLRDSVFLKLLYKYYPRRNGRKYHVLLNAVLPVFFVQLKMKSFFQCRKTVLLNFIDVIK